MQRDEFVHSSFQASGTSVSLVYDKSQKRQHLALPFCWLSFLLFFLGISRKYSLDF